MIMAYTVENRIIGITAASKVFDAALVAPCILFLVLKLLTTFSTF